MFNYLYADQGRLNEFEIMSCSLLKEAHLPSRCARLFSSSCFPSSTSFSASTQVLPCLFSLEQGPPLRALQAALSCRMRAGSSRVSDKPPQVTGGVFRGPHSGEPGGSSGQTPRPESRILRSEPQCPSSTGIVQNHTELDG